MALCGACTVHLDGAAGPLLRHAGVGGAGQERHDDRRTVRRQQPSGAAGVDRARRAAVRLLPVGADHVGGGAAGKNKNPTDADIDAAMSRQHLPLRYLQSHTRGDPSRGGRDDERSLGMKHHPQRKPADLSQRVGLRSAAGSSSASPFRGRPCSGSRGDGDARAESIRSSRSAATTVTVLVRQSEMGQGV